MNDVAAVLETIERNIERDAERSFALLERLVGQASTVGHESGAQEVVGSELAAIGLRPEKMMIDDSIGNDPLAGVPALSYANRFNVVATPASPGNSPSLLLNGHIDVVPVSDSGWTNPPFSPVRRDGWLYGRGAGDMKAGFASTLHALRHVFDQVPELRDAPLTFLSVIEEECTGNGTLAALRAGISADAVLLPEPTDLRLLMGGVGVSWIAIRLELGGGHAESSDRLGSPADLLGELLAALKELEATYNESADAYLSAVPHPYNLNVGKVSMGDWPSSVASLLHLEVRVGHSRSRDSQSVLDDVRALVHRVAGGLADTSVSVHRHGFRAEPYHLDDEHALAGAMRFVCRAATGLDATPYSLGSTTDARYYVNQAKVPALCFGPTVRNMHGTDESVEMSSIVRASKTYAHLVVNYFVHGGLGGYESGRWV